MNLLGIDTSTEACTVALQLGDDRHESIVLERQHAERILGEIEQLLGNHNSSLPKLDAIVWGRGPGMFTGLRIGAGVVQGLAYAANLPVVCVSSLAVIAAGQPHPRVISAIDARMDQVYWAAYEKGAKGLVPLTEEQVCNPVEVGRELPEQITGSFIGAGSGWDQYHDALVAGIGGRLNEWIPRQYPTGVALLALGEQAFAAGEAVPAMEALPVYVRDKVAKKTVERQSS